MTECLAPVSHSSIKAGEYAPAVSEPFSCHSTSSLSMHSVFPSFQAKSYPANRIDNPPEKMGKERKHMTKFIKFQETDLMLKQFRRQRNKPLSMKQKKRECRAVAAEVKNFFSDDIKLRPVPQRIYPDPQKLENIKAFFFRPPLTQEQKNLECWRNMGPSKIRKRVCRKIAVSVQSHHFRVQMASFQEKLKTCEPSEEDKVKISSLIAGEIKGFFIKQTCLRHTIRATRRIYPDPEKVNLVNSFFFRPPLTQEQKNLECWRNMGPSKIKVRKRVCRKIVVSVQSHHFRVQMASFQEKLKTCEPSEEDKVKISSLIAGEIKGFFITQTCLRHTIRATRRIYPDPEKVNLVNSFFFRPPLTQEQKNLECWRNMGPSKIKIRKRVCRKIAVSVQSHHFRVQMASFQEKLKTCEPSEEDKVKISSLIAGEIKGFFITQTCLNHLHKSKTLRHTIRATRRIYPDPEKVNLVNSFFFRPPLTQEQKNLECWRNMGPSKIKIRKRVCRKIAVSVQSHHFRVQMASFQEKLKTCEPSEEDKVKNSSLIAGEIKGFFITRTCLRHTIRATRRIYPDPEKVNLVNSFFFRPPLTQEQKNLECWRNMGPSKIKIRKRVCRKIAVSVQSHHFRVQMASFQEKLKTCEPSEEDKVKISSLIAGEIIGFFITRTFLRHTVKIVRRIYPDPEKVAKLASCFCREIDASVSGNACALTTDYQQSICRRMAVAVRCYFFGLLFISCEKRVTDRKPCIEMIEDDHLLFSCWKNRRILHPTIKVTLCA